MIELQLGGSQFPPSQRMPHAIYEEPEIDPRVVPHHTASTGGSFEVKNSGEREAMAASLSKIRKRAYRRARRRAEANGATWYRGVWRSAKSLGTCSEKRPLADPSNAARKAATAVVTKPRLRVMTFNPGGLDLASYDVLCDWLQRQKDTDIIFAQELHWAGKVRSAGT